MVQYLLRHPLVLAVGSEKGGEGAETHLLDASEALRAQPDGFKGGVLFNRLGRAHGTGSLGDVLAVQQELVRTRLAAREDPMSAVRIAREGVVVHYTPHYMFVPGLPGAICDLSRAAGGAPCAELRYLVMLREPASRAVSSWWYHHRRGALADAVADGARALRALEKCYSGAGVDFLELCASVHRKSRGAGDGAAAAGGGGGGGGDLGKFSEHTEKLSACSDALLVTGGDNAGFSAHVGKSLYAHQLVHWFARLPLGQFYIMALEDYGAAPLREFTQLLCWLGLAAVDEHGIRGFRDREAIAAELAVHYNTAPITHDAEVNEIAPVRQTLLDLFDPQNRALEVLLSGSAAPADDGVASWARVRQVLLRSRDEQTRDRRCWDVGRSPGAER